MGKFLLLLVLAFPAFSSPAPADARGAEPEIFAGSIQVTAEPEPWRDVSNPGLTTVEAALIDAPAEVEVGNTLMAGSGIALSTMIQAAAMVALASLAGAFVLAARV